MVASLFKLTKLFGKEPERKKVREILWYSQSRIQSSSQTQDEMEATSQEWFSHAPHLVYLHFDICIKTFH